MLYLDQWVIVIFIKISLKFYFNVFLQYKIIRPLFIMFLFYLKFCCKLLCKPLIPFIVNMVKILNRPEDSNELSFIFYIMFMAEV